ncbi:tetratricopeptide repeat protein 38-like [Ylistrum balloti]|uniref:tetratricopeptide repeat protein 38-like n=1 Tax=Ylistrum balloti TaxID=509963 RepID=UPI0029059456|nr:tetratricopeptide repeat protein 38-like [Ylistrum balloti]
MSHIRTNLRGCKDWTDFGYPLSTSSDEACKLYDAAISQLVGFYEDHNFGGLSGTIEKMLKADPEFVMGHILSLGIKMVGTVFIASDDPIREEVTKLEQLMSNRNVTDIESKHLEAIRKLLDADLPGAVAVWDSILHLNHFDALAIRHVFFGCFFLGAFAQCRDILSRIVSEWCPSTPLYGYFLGEYAFVSQETFLFQRAERDALRALEMNRHDIFARHAVSHVYEMQGRVEEGLKLVEGSENDWNICDHLACHMYWHNSLYHVEKGNYDEAIGIYDTELVKRYKDSKSAGNMVDCSSLLYRLELENFSVGERWNDLLRTIDDGIKKHTNLYIDPHLLMTCLGAKDSAATTAFMDTFRESVRNGHGHSRGVSERIVLPLCEALQAHDDGDHGKVVDLTYPLRHEFSNFGGSNAQRDVFNLLLIDSSLKSSREEHRNFGRHLLVERKAFKENSPMTDRLMEKILVSHVK